MSFAWRWRRASLLDRWDRQVLEETFWFLLKKVGTHRNPSSGMPLQGLTAQHRGGWVSKRLEPHRNQGSNKGKDKLCRMDTKGEDKLSRMLRKLFTEGPVDALRLHPCRGPLFRGWVDALRFTSCGLSQVEGSGFSHKRYRKRLSGSRSFHDFLLQVAALPTTLPSRPCGCCPAGAFFFG